MSTREQIVETRKAINPIPQRQIVIKQRSWIRNEAKDKAELAACIKQAKAERLAKGF